MKLIIIALIVCMSLSFAKAQNDNEWELWKKENHKEYSNARGLLNADSEEEIRENIFEENLNNIKEFNSKNNSFEMGLNEFSDLSEDELNSRFNAHIDINKVKKNIKNCNKSEVSKGRIISDTVNWVSSGYVAPVKNQGSCGSCYAFSTADALESAHAIKFGLRFSPRTFSPQQLLDCSYYRYSIGGAVGNLGCNGGYDYHTLYYVQQNGIQLGSSYPYVGYVQSCRYSSRNVVTKLSGIYTASYSIGDVNAMKAVVSRQPLMVYMYVTSDFYSYKSGIYNGPNCQSSTKSCPIGINHAVTIVGYGTENGVPFWRVKNSWGTTWGEAGYFRIAMSKNTCCIEGYSYYPGL